MSILWINLLIVFTFSFFSRYFASIGIAENNLLVIKPNKVLAFGALLSLAVISGLRNNIGDTPFYAHSYQITNFSWETIKKQKDIGFGLLQMVLKNYTHDPQIFIFTVAVITNTLIVIVLYKYSRLFDLSIYVFITGGLYLVTMNGIRQCLAAAIIFTGTKFLIERNGLKYLFVILLAATFHESALILIPIYFLVQYKAWSKATFLLLVFSILIVLGFNQFSSLLFSAIQDTQYSEYKNFSEGGANILRVLVFAVPLVIAFFGREKLRQINPKIDYIVNMSIVGLVFMIIATKDWIFARFSIYFELYQIILISWIVKVFYQKDEKFIYFLIIIFYLLYYYYEDVKSLNIFYKSNYL